MGIKLAMNHYNLLVKYGHILNGLSIISTVLFENICGYLVAEEETDR